MKFIPTALAGAYIVEQTASRDERGYFTRVFCSREFAEHGLWIQFAQMNHSLSLRRGTVRGLHYQLPPNAEVKLVRCVRGAVQDVIVDVRRGSPTFLRWHSEILTEDNLKQVYVPGGFAHGYQALVDGASVTYQTSSPYAPAHERGLRHDDPVLRIDWQVSDAIVSPKDVGWPLVDTSFAGVVLPAPLAKGMTGDEVVEGRRL